MDPISSALTTLISAAQNAGQPGASAVPVSALLALVGQEVRLELLGQAPGGGLLLELPSGQTVTAQGQLPYPDGTQLLVRILAGSGAGAPLLLQTLSAAPPAAPAILAPLLQGEAAPLQASLAQPDPPAGLAALAELFQFLGGGDPAQGQPPQLPGVNQIQAALDALPASAQASLASLLAPAGSAAPGTSLAASLASWLATAQSASAGNPAVQHAPDPVQALIQDLLQRFQNVLEHHPDLPAAQADSLAGWLKNLLSGSDAKPAAAQARTPTASADSPAQTLLTLLGGRSAAPASAPETWETWIRGAVKALTDPATAPQGAAFHAAQAKEGTAFFEIPLPWSPQNHLQMWLESDRDPREQGNAKAETQRVLLGLNFTNLGETRLGIAKSGGNLQVRVWTEHPELLEPTRAAVESELQELGSAVDLKVMRLEPGPGGTVPSLRSQVTGPTLDAMG